MVPPPSANTPYVPEKIRGDSDDPGHALVSDDPDAPGRLDHALGGVALAGRVLRPMQLANGPLQQGQLVVGQSQRRPMLVLSLICAILPRRRAWAVGLVSRAGFFALVVPRSSWTERFKASMRSTTLSAGAGASAATMVRPLALAFTSSSARSSSCRCRRRDRRERSCDRPAAAPCRACRDRACARGWCRNSDRPAAAHRRSG